MLTPTVSNTFTDNLKSTQQKEGSTHSVTLAQIVNRPDLLPTPTTMEHLPPRTGEARERQLRRGGTSRRKTSGNLREDILLLGTPRVSSHKGSTASQVEAGAPKSRLEDQVLTNTWGKYEPAIKLWEQILGIPAPAPTRPDGKNDIHRLNPEFAEWLMGIPGRLDGVDLTRAERLKMAGNGVCPQQAFMAFSELLERLNK